MGGYKYFITFINNYSMFRYIYLMHRRFDVLDKFIGFKAESKNQLDKHVKIEVVS